MMENMMKNMPKNNPMKGMFDMWKNNMKCSKSEKKVEDLTAISE